MSRNPSPVEGATVTTIGAQPTKNSNDALPIHGKIALKFREAAQLMSVSERSVYRLVEAGELPAVQPIVGARRIMRADLDAYLEAHPWEPAA
ncbi:helix-turn-helix domain-containing protein [Rhodococcoides fascians]|uniref:helix-turn-helix domain-containing protein n=1 Tax=Rhodococcoides fascians TaxID=1828 RepID=UPI000565A27D|nr:helix-turn-helix domain-containing protein [Rhodococcus fascians]